MEMMDRHPREGLFGPAFVVPGLAAALTAAHAAVVSTWGRLDYLGWPGLDRRLGLYVLCASVAALLTAVVSTGLGLYLSSENHRVARLRRRAGQAGRRVWTRALLALLLVALTAMVAYGGEPKPPATSLWPRMIFQWATLVAILRVGYALAFFTGQIKTHVDGHISPKPPPRRHASEFKPGGRRAG